ncbi:30S ribosomal protein S15 [Candidatus Berkelbacteria bacterium]|nr:30S ribosomal protein S15 [Candidatus Berkelbacteria bacterium]
MAEKKTTKKTTAKAAAKKTESKKATPKAKAPAVKATAKKAAAKSMVEKYRTHKGDTGSTVVQIATLSDSIDDLVKHLKKHKKDNDSRRGLLIMVGKRRRLLNYLNLSDEKTYQKLIKDLKLRK